MRRGRAWSLRFFLDITAWKGKSKGRGKREEGRIKAAWVLPLP
jgi:hypothetical protein